MRANSPFLRCHQSMPPDHLPNRFARPLIVGTNEQRYGTKKKMHAQKTDVFLWFAGRSSGRVTWWSTDSTETNATECVSGLERVSRCQQLCRLDGTLQQPRTVEGRSKDASHQLTALDVGRLPATNQPTPTTRNHPATLQISSGKKSWVRFGIPHCWTRTSFSLVNSLVIKLTSSTLNEVIRWFGETIWSR